MSIGGIMRGLPELGLYKTDRKENHIFGNHVVEKHINFNKRIHTYDKPFSDNRKIKILVIGNSFARDWCNIILEFSFADSFDLSYIEERDKKKAKLDNRPIQADIIFLVCASREDATRISSHYKKDSLNFWNIGPKNFGVQNGLIYANRKQPDYFNQTAKLDSEILNKNENLKSAWGEKYVDLLSFIKNSNNEVPVFTPDHHFFSQDCIHLTQAGAQFFAGVIPWNKITNTFQKETPQ